MKRLTVAGLFAMIGGAATLLMVASILYSCRQGGHPHDMGNDPHSGRLDAPPTVVTTPEARPDAVGEAQPLDGVPSPQA